MKIGVLSDTHGEIGLIERALGVLDSFQVDLIIHCGDVGLEVPPLFGDRCVHFVVGNMDDAEGLRDAVAGPGHTLHERLGSLELEGRRVAFLHGDDVKLLHHTIHSGHWDLVCYGHTHAFSHGREGPTVVLNPGALGRTSHPSMAVVELPSLEVKEIALQKGEGGRRKGEEGVY